MEYYKNLDLAPIEYFCEFDKVLKIEEWKDIKYYEGIYQVSDLGRVKSLSRIVPFRKKFTTTVHEVILKGCADFHGYRNVTLSIGDKSKTVKIHQLVAIAFLNHKPCRFEWVVNHKNFIKTDNRKLNLEIVTFRENTNHKHLKSSSKYTGVSWDKKNKKWLAQIYIEGVAKNLGRYDKEIEANNAYQKKLAETNSK